MTKHAPNATELLASGMKKTGSDGVQRLHPRLLFGILVLLLVAPSVVWVLRDASVWTWDPAMYALFALRNARSLIEAPSQWYTNLMTPAATGPMLVWLAQLLVPLGQALGRVETGMLLTNVLLAAATLSCVGGTTYRLTRRLSGVATALFACGGAAMFIAMERMFLAEMSQAAAVSFLMITAFEAGRLRIAILFPRLVAAATLAMLAKFSSFIIVVPFLTYAGLAMWLGRREPKQVASSGRVAFEALAALVLLVATLTWYWHNWVYVFAHARRFSVTSDALFYGSEGSLITKLPFWFDGLSKSLSVFAPFGYLLLLFSLVAVLLVLWRTIRSTPFTQCLADAFLSGYLFVLCLAGIVVLTLVSYSLQINEDIRFVTPLIPVVAVLLGWTACAFGSRFVSATFTILLAANLLASQALATGAFQIEGAIGHLVPPMRSLPSLDRIEQAARASCAASPSGQPVGIAVSLPDFNQNSLEFEAEKARPASTTPCHFVSYSPYLTDANEALRTLDALKAEIVLTLPIEQLPADASNPWFYANAAAHGVAEELAASDAFERISASDAPFVLYRRR
jgi:hypothetical protein